MVGVLMFPGVRALVLTRTQRELDLLQRAGSVRTLTAIFRCPGSHDGDA
jgi:hypothetical protein